MTTPRLHTDTTTRKRAEDANMNTAQQSGRLASLHLSDKQCLAFQTDGYALLGPVLSSQQLADLREAEAQLRATRRDHDAANPLTIFRHQVAPQVPAIREFATTGPHLSVLQQLIGPNLVFWYTQFVTKLDSAPRSGVSLDLRSSIESRHRRS